MAGPPDHWANQTLILVDENDRGLGYAPRDVCHLGDGKLHRAIAVALFNDRGDMLLQKRKSFLWDGFWDVTGATHTLKLKDHDESYLEAGARFLDAEWKTSSQLSVEFSFLYFERFGEYCENELCALLVGKADRSIRLAAEHAYAMKWTSLEDCLSEIESEPSTFTPWAIIALRKLASRRGSVRKSNGLV